MNGSVGLSPHVSPPTPTAPLAMRKQQAKDTDILASGASNGNTAPLSIPRLSSSTSRSPRMKASSPSMASISVSPSHLPALPAARVAPAPSASRSTATSRWATNSPTTSPVPLKTTTSFTPAALPPPSLSPATPVSAAAPSTNPTTSALAAKLSNLEVSQKVPAAAPPVVRNVPTEELRPVATPSILKEEPSSAQGEISVPTKSLVESVPTVKGKEDVIASEADDGGEWKEAKKKSRGAEKRGKRSKTKSPAQVAAVLPSSGSKGVIPPLNFGEGKKLPLAKSTDTSMAAVLSTPQATTNASKSPTSPSPAESLPISPPMLPSAPREEPAHIDWAMDDDLDELPALSEDWMVPTSQLVPAANSRKVSGKKPNPPTQLSIAPNTNTKNISRTTSAPSPRTPGPPPHQNNNNGPRTPRSPSLNSPRVPPPHLAMSSTPRFGGMRSDEPQHQPSSPRGGYEGGGVRGDRGHVGGGRGRGGHGRGGRGGGAAASPGLFSRLSGMPVKPRGGGGFRETGREGGFNGERAATEGW